MASVKPLYGAQLIKGHPLAQGLVGAWLFNEGGGGTVYDLSGMDHHGTLTGMDPNTDWVSTPDGWGLDLDGASDCVPLDIPMGTTFNFTTPYTLTIRFASTAVAWDQYDVALANINLGGNSGYRLWVPDAGGVTMQWYQWTAANEVVINITGAIAANVWHTIAAGWDGSNLFAYQNGQLVGTTPSGVATYVGGGNPPRAVLGAMTNVQGGTTFQRFAPLTAGYVVIHNRALSATEVAAFYADPYQMFERPAWRRYWRSVGGVGPHIFTSHLGRVGPSLAGWR